MVSVKRYYPTRDQPKLSPDTKTVVHLFFFFLPLENNKVSSGGREEARSDFHLQKSPVSSAFYKPTPSSRGKGVRGKSEILEGNKKKKVKVVDRFVMGTSCCGIKHPSTKKGKASPCSLTGNRVLLVTNFWENFL